jgi:hypothetical protein
MKLNPVLLEEDRHRRMNVLVGAADFESALTQRRRHGAHGRAANPNEISGARFSQTSLLPRRVKFASKKKHPKVSVVIQVSRR